MDEYTAYHESGHAYLAYQLGGEVRQITIEPEWNDLPGRYGDVQIARPTTYWLTRRWTANRCAKSSRSGRVIEAGVFRGNIDQLQCRCENSGGRWLRPQ